MTFDLSPYGTKTGQEVLNIVENLKLKGYKLLNIKNAYEGFVTNSFTFQKTSKSGKPKKEYLRLYLISEGFHKERLFYWKIDFNFKPFKKCDKWKSEGFKGTADDLYISRFLEAIKQIEDFDNKKDRGWFKRK